MAGAPHLLMTPQELRDRSMQFSVRAVRFAKTLPETWDARKIGGQLIDSATSVAINYRAAGRGRSHREFTAKIGVVVEEVDETVGWLEMIAELKLSTDPELLWLLTEARELVAIFGRSYHTARAKERSTGR
jgi:four helix bundle protein